MKSLLLPLLVLLFAHQGYAQAAKKTADKISNSDFDGTWTGSEKCQNISAPLAKITITAKGEDKVNISGLYSSTGEVEGTIKNNVINIPMQQVPDPIFNNLKIDGNLTLSKNRKTLDGIFIIHNNDAHDDCGANYHR